MKKQVNNYELTIVVPAYNAEKHLLSSLPSLLNERCAKENILPFYEVIIVNDGSKDDTLKVAQEWQAKWNARQPDLVKVVDKENGQYGSVINYALKIAKGKYFKILDADDWFNVDCFIKLIFTLKGFEPNFTDIVVTDHVYEKVNFNQEIVNSFYNYFPSERLIKFSNIKFPRDLITMHSLIYSTNLLQRINYHQLEKYYYTDSQFAIIPFCYATSLYYLQLPLYCYYIGSEEQSINVANMIKNRSHQLLVMQTLLQEIDVEKIRYKTVKKYLFISLRRMLQWQFLLIIIDKNITKKYPTIKAIFKDIKNIQRKNNNKIISGAFFRLIKITRGLFIRSLITLAFRIYSKVKLQLIDGI